MSAKLQQFYPLADASTLSEEALAAAYKSGGASKVLQHCLDQAKMATEKKVRARQMVGWLVRMCRRVLLSCFVFVIVFFFCFALFSKRLVSPPSLCFTVAFWRKLFWISTVLLSTPFLFLFTGLA